MLPLFLALLAHADVPAPPGLVSRVASVAISQDFLNEQLREHVKSPLVQDLRIELDAAKNVIFFHGVAQVPVEELRAINLEPDLGKFRFQVAARLTTSRKGYLIIEFPLNETYFYPMNSKDPQLDRVVVPVQMLSIALASARGYLAALSGDFGGFDREAAKLRGLKKALDRAIAGEKNPDVKDDLVTQRESLRLKLAAIPIERKQLMALAKEFSTILSFTGEKELNLNDDLAAKRNALMLKIRLSQLTPYLTNTGLDGVHLFHNKKDGGGETYFVVHVNALLENDPGPMPTSPPDAGRKPMKTAPVLMMRLKQSLFESRAVLDREKQRLSDSGVKDFKLEMRDDGLHVTGRYKAFLFFTFPFETTIDFESTAPDEFEAKVREVKVGGNDFKFLAKYALESLQNRLNTSLKGTCEFEYVGEQGDSSYALRVRVKPEKLAPAFPGLHLLDVDVRLHEFLLKVGRI